jgi:3-deoxy-manno-octulosonate cytidylyltransferase (CMP-KDO synthetase)
MNSGAAMSSESFAVVLPARYQSTRFPGKPLALLAGRPLIEWVYRRAERIRGAGEVVVATDDVRIVEAVGKFGGRVVMTSNTHRTGADRVAAVARDLDYDVIVNLQGDEPVVPEGLVEGMVSAVRDMEEGIVTACHRIHDPTDLENPNVVKIVMNDLGRVLYFSRSPIPYGAWKSFHGRSAIGAAYRHIGIYAYKKQSLLEFAELQPSKLEMKEGLEQLRALENGMAMRVIISEKPTAGVDVPGDIKNVEKLLLKN